VPLLWLLGAAVAVFVIAQVIAPRSTSPLTIAELTRCGSIANPLPVSFLPRARALGVLAGQLRDLGFTITSAYRGRTCDDAVLDANAAAGINNLGQHGPGPHSECRAFDVGLDAKRPTPSALLQALRALGPDSKAQAPSLGNLLAESNHVHIDFDGATLDELGAAFIAANPTFDLEGAASVADDSVSDVLGQTVGEVTSVVSSIAPFGAGQSTDQNSSNIVFGVGDMIPAGVDPNAVGLAPGTFADGPLPDGTFVVKSF
jgi:hypothetical protein